MIRADLPVRPALTADYVPNEGILVGNLCRMDAICVISTTYVNCHDKDKIGIVDKSASNIFGNLHTRHYVCRR
jgi:hypothetical protein